MTYPKPSNSRGNFRGFRGFRGRMHPVGSRRSVGDMSLRELAQFFGGRGDGPQMVRSPYSQVVAVHACVRARANALAMMGMRVSTVQDEVLEDGPLVALTERPAEGLSRRRFWQAVSAFVDLFGKCYLVKHLTPGSPGSPGSNTLLAMRPIAPIEIAERRDHTGAIVGYTYTPIAGRGVSVELSPEEVHPIVEPDYGTGDLTRALSPRHAAGLAIAQHYQADVANERSLRFGAGGGIGLTTDRNLTEQQRDRVERVLEDRHSGIENRHRWMLLEGGLKPEQLFSTFAEMEFSELKFYSREDICVSFGLNPLVVGFGGREGLGSGQHTEAAHVIAWTDTHLPRAEWFAEEWTEAIAPHVAADKSLTMRDARRRAMVRREAVQPMRRELHVRAIAKAFQFYAWFDASNVAILQRANLELAKQGGEWIDKGVPLNQVLGAYDLPFEEVPWGNTWWRPFGLIDVQDESATLPGADDPSSGVDDPDLPTDDEDVQADKGALHHKRLSAAQLERLWIKWRESWMGLERQMRSRVSRHFNELRTGVLARLNAHLSDGKSIAPSQRRDLLGEILFDLVDADRKLLVRVRPLIRETYRLGGEQVMAEHAAASGSDKSDPFAIDDPGVQQAMRRREIRIKESNRTLRRRLAGQIADGLEQKETVSQIAQRLRKEFNQASARANTIARTEVGGAMEDARQAARSQADVPAKSWLWSRRETGRPWHMDCEQQTMARPIPNQADFILPQTGAQTPHPRGPGLGAEDAVNCGCGTLNRYPNDQVRDARMLLHYVERGFLTYDALQRRDVKQGGNRDNAQ